MHTFTHGKTTIHHNDDFSGVVTIIQAEAPFGAGCVEVPFEALRALVAEQVGLEKIRALEQADDQAIVMGHLRQDEP